MITVADLIERLKAFPADMPVVVSGFDEGGFDPLQTIAEVEIVRRSGGGHVGDFELAEETPVERRQGDPFRALHLDF